MNKTLIGLLLVALLGIVGAVTVETDSLTGEKGYQKVIDSLIKVLS